MEVRELFSIVLPNFALAVALYTFLSNNSKFREFSSGFCGVVIWELVSLFFCAILLLISICNQFIYGKLNSIIIILQFLIALSLLIATLLLLSLFYKIFGSLYHLRNRRFFKYIKGVSIIYEKCFHKQYYEMNHKERTKITFGTLDLSPDEYRTLAKGGVVLILYDDYYKTEEFIYNFITGTMNDEETIDYIAVQQSPLNVCNYLVERKNTTQKLSIIDCFSPHYAYDDKVTKILKEDYKNKGIQFYDANSFAEIHTSLNNSWYRFRELSKSQEDKSRIPHRSIYDTLSSLIRVSSEEQFFSYVKHVAYSEKFYGMITVLLEPCTLESSTKNELIRIADFVIDLE